MKGPGWQRFTAAAAAIALASLPLPSRGQDARALSEAAAAVEQVQGQLRAAEDNLRVVETQWTQHPEPSADELLQGRFLDGEIKYLLGDTLGASVLFYDLISDARFQGSPRLSDALFYLADSLYQMGNLLGARVYLRQLLAMKSPNHHAQALGRFLDVAGRTNELDGIEGYLAEARGASGQLPKDLSYVYGKWLFRRKDLPAAERLKRLEETFAALADDPEAPYRLQSSYYLGVAYVQHRSLDRAIAQLEKLLQLPARDAKETKIKELANLSLGRLYYEVGRYDDALDRYQEVPRESENFPDSLHEIAWCQVKKGEFERAKNATDILLLVAPDSTLAPEAKILQGHLQLKLKRYDEADGTYDQVVNDYAPVYDEINALLTVEDPVSYFDKLLARNEKNLDVVSLLPVQARKWATQKEVADAVRMINDLESGRRGIAEAADIAGRVLKALEERGLEAFPQIQEGYTRAEAVDAALTRAEQALVRAETQVTQEQLKDAERAQLEKVKAEIEALQKRFASVPTTQAEVEARRRRMHDRVDAADRQAFKLGYELQSLNAMLVAVEKWLDDNRNVRKSTPEDEKAFRARIQAELDVVDQLGKELQGLRSDLAQERASADASVPGEDVIRKEYLAALSRQHQLIAAAEGRLGPEAAQVVQRAHTLRESASRLRERVGAGKLVLREQLARRGKQLRETVLSEQRLLAEYQRSAAAVSADANNLVGQIAFDSFQRVRQQFYDLVLKANVGTVDVAFTRKQDKTQQIQKMAAEKDRELRALDSEFREVLKDVD